jgi:hypothetical protein
MRVDFSAGHLEQGTPGIREREVDVGGTRWALVTYGPGVLREEYCDVGHSGYVTGGDITYEFEDGGEPLELHTGDGFALPAARRHRGRAGADGATLFLIDAEVGHGG